MVRLKILLLIIVISLCLKIEAQNSQVKKQYAKIVIKTLNLSPDSSSAIILTKERHVKKIAKIFLIEKYGFIRTLWQVPLSCALYKNYWVIWKQRCLKKRKGLGTLVIINGINCHIVLININK